MTELVRRPVPIREESKPSSYESPEISNQVFCSNYMMMFFFYGLGRCQIRLAGTGSLSRYTYKTVFTVKKNGR